MEWSCSCGAWHWWGAPNALLQVGHLLTYQAPACSTDLSSAGMFLWSADNPYCCAGYSVCCSSVTAAERSLRRRSAFEYINEDSSLEKWWICGDQILPLKNDEFAATRWFVADKKVKKLFAVEVMEETDRALNVMKNMPHVLPFMERVRLFRQWVEEERATATRVMHRWGIPILYVHAGDW